MSDYRTVLAVLDPGSGTRAVVAHLADVREHATVDLTRAPHPQRLLIATLDHWIDTAVGPTRRILDRTDPEFAVAQFARLPAPESVTGFPAAQAARHITQLRTHGWLIAAVGTGTRTHYRAAIGAPFGVTPLSAVR